MNVGEAITAGIKANARADYEAVRGPRRITLRGGPHNGREIIVRPLGGCVRIPSLTPEFEFIFDDYDPVTGNYLEAQ